MKQIILLILANVYISVYGQESDTAFWKKISSDFSRNSYFVSINIIVNRSVLPVVITNEELYYFFYKTRKYDKTQYLQYLKKILGDKDTLRISATMLKGFHFTVAKRNRKIDSEANKGLGSFLNRYFNKGVLVDGISNADQFYIIKWLFSWKVLTRLDDESGYLVL